MPTDRRGQRRRSSTLYGWHSWHPSANHLLRPRRQRPRRERYRHLDRAERPRGRPLRHVRLRRRRARQPDDRINVWLFPRRAIVSARPQSCESPAFGERSATRAIVRVRTRFDARTRLWVQRLAVLLCAENRASPRVASNSH